MGVVERKSSYSRIRGRLERWRQKIGWPRGERAPSHSGHRRVLAVVSHFKYSHIPYLLALSRLVDIQVAWSHEVDSGSIGQAVRSGLGMAEVGVVRRFRKSMPHPAVGEQSPMARLAAIIRRCRPSLVHVMYYYHDDLTLMARELVGDGIPIIYECRDPITTLWNAAIDSEMWRLEASALRAADGYIFVSKALQRHLEKSHGLDLERASLIVPHAFPAATAAPISEKLSAEDGRIHIALVGTADLYPDHGRWYCEIIRRLVSLGFVVHSHFFESADPAFDAYRRLADELADYHFHTTVTYKRGTDLSRLISRYDLMGVFHELGATHHNESRTLAVCMPTKAVSGWFHGAIPVITFPHYRGITEVIAERGNGFVIENWDDLRALISEKPRIDAATERCLEIRHEFSHEHQAGRISGFYERCVRRHRMRSDS